MRELGKEGVAVARLWLGKQIAVSHIIVKMHTCEPTTDRERVCGLTLHMRCAASREYLVANRCSPHR